MPYIDGVSCGCEGFCTSDCAYSNGLNVCSDSTCSNRCTDWSSRLVKIEGIERVPSDPTTIKQYLIKKGPLAAAYGLGSSQFGGHWDGDIYRCTNDNDANHAILLVGYNDAGGYWIAKNSWGTSYQDQGYFKIGYGECFIERYVHSVQAYAENAPLLTNPQDKQVFTEGQVIPFAWNPEEGAEYYGEIKGGPQGTTSFGWQNHPRRKSDPCPPATHIHGRLNPVQEAKKAAGAAHAVSPSNLLPQAAWPALLHKPE